MTEPTGMMSAEKEERAAIDAHTTHTTALLKRISGNQPIEDVHFYVDSDKVERVAAETS